MPNRQGGAGETPPSQHKQSEVDGMVRTTLASKVVFGELRRHPDLDGENLSSRPRLSDILF